MFGSRQRDAQVQETLTLLQAGLGISAHVTS